MVNRNYIYIRDFHPSDAVLSEMDDKRFDLITGTKCCVDCRT